MRSQISTRARVGQAVRTLGEAEPLGPACHLRQLGLGAGEIAAHEADQGQVDVRRRDRLVGLEPHRVDLVLVCGGQPARGLLEVGTGGIELAAQPRHHPQPDLDHRTQPRPPLPGPRAATRAPGPPGAGQRARCSSSLGRSTSRPVRRPAGRCRPAAGTARSRRRRRGLTALYGRGEESPLQPQGHFAAVAVWAGCGAVELREGQASGRCGPRPARRGAGQPLMPAGRPRPPRRSAAPARSGRRPAASPGLRRHTTHQGIGHLRVQSPAHARGRHLGGHLAQQLVAKPPAVGSPRLKHQRVLEFVDDVVDLVLTQGPPPSTTGRDRRRDR